MYIVYIQIYFVHCIHTERCRIEEEELWAADLFIARENDKKRRLEIQEKLMEYVIDGEVYYMYMRNHYMGRKRQLTKEKQIDT